MNRRDMLVAMAGAGVAGIAPRCFSQDSGAPGNRVIVSRIGLVDGRVVMPITIGGKGPYLFLIDTGGATSMIEDELARELKLQVTGTVSARGIGGRAMLGTYMARDVVFGGGARQATVSMAGMAGGFGARVRGALAAGMLTAVDGDLDIEAGQWRVYPDGRPDRSGFVKIEKAIRSNMNDRNRASPRLYGEVAVNGQAFDCLLDTGAPGAISLSYDHGRRLRLWDDARPFAPQGSSGIGGSGGIGRIVRADHAEFGGVRFERPLVLVRGPQDGSRGQHDGIVGLSLLRRFNLSTDVRAKALWVQPHGDTKSVQERYGLSGLWLERKGEEVRVAAVGTGSPAAGAGVAVNDQIIGLDFGAAIAKISGKPGQVVELNVAGASGSRVVKLTLQPFL